MYKIVIGDFSAVYDTIEALNIAFHAICQYHHFLELDGVVELKRGSE